MGWHEDMRRLMDDPVYKFGIAMIFVIMMALLFAMSARADSAMVGEASYYTFNSCRREGTSGVWTASGERFNENDLTCAMRSRAWGRKYKVTNIDNGKSVIVKCNDFGPNKKLHARGRIIDLSRAAFERIEDLKRGVIRVRVEAI